jgi:hypothetical protein
MYWLSTSQQFIRTKTCSGNINTCEPGVSSHIALCDCIRTLSVGIYYYYLSTFRWQGYSMLLKRWISRHQYTFSYAFLWQYKPSNDLFPHPRISKLVLIRVQKTEEALTVLLMKEWNKQDSKVLFDRSHVTQRMDMLQYLTHVAPIGWWA